MTKKSFNEISITGGNNGSNTPQKTTRRKRRGGRKKNTRYMMLSRNLTHRLYGEKEIEDQYREIRELFISEEGKKRIKSFLDDNGVSLPRSKSVSNVVNDYHIPVEMAEEIYNEWRREWCSSTKAI